MPFLTLEGDTTWYLFLNVVIGIRNIIDIKGLVPDVARLAYIRNKASTYVNLVFKNVLTLPRHCSV